MTPERMIEKEIVRRGMTLREAGRRSGVKYSRLQPALGGAAELRADEYISLCLLLDVDPRAYRDTK